MYLFCHVILQDRDKGFRGSMGGSSSLYEATPASLVAIRILVVEI